MDKQSFEEWLECELNRLQSTIHELQGYSYDFVATQASLMTLTKAANKFKEEKCAK